jgi:WD40 repeat protein
MRFKYRSIFIPQGHKFRLSRRAIQLSFIICHLFFACRVMAISSPADISLPVSNQKEAFIYAVHFDYDKYVIKPYFQKSLNILVDAIASADPSRYEFVIEGHTDFEGPHEYNFKLSRNRALQLKKYLLAKLQTDIIQFDIRAFGETKPVNTNKTDLGKVANRRSLIIIKSTVKATSGENNNQNIMKFGEIQSFALSNNGRTIFSSSHSDEPLIYWELASGKKIKKFNDSLSANSVDISTSSKLAVTGGNDGIVKLWDIESGKLKRVFPGNNESINVVAFSSDDRYVLSGGEGNHLTLWDTLTGKEWIKYQGHANTVLTADFSPEGKYMVSGSTDKSINLWDVQTGALLKTFKGHDWGVFVVKFSPLGGFILSGSGDNTLRLWDVIKGRTVQVFKGHDWVVLDADFSPDGQFMVSGGRDKTVKLWNINTGKLVRTLVGHTDYVNSVAFSPDGLLIISASKDKTIRMWNRYTGELIRVIGKK